MSLLAFALFASLAVPTDAAAERACWTDCGVTLTEISGYRRDPWLVWLETLGVAAWRDSRSGVLEVYVGSLSAQGCGVHPDSTLGARISAPGVAASGLNVVSDGRRVPIVWTDSRLGYRQAWWACLDSAGRQDPRWPPGGARIGTDSSTRSAGSIVAIDSLAWIETTVTEAPRTNAWLFRRSLDNPEYSPEWPANGLCVTCEDSASAYSLGIAPVSRDRAFVAYYSAEDSGSIVCSALEHPPGSDSLAWTVRRLLQRRAAITGDWHVVADNAGGAYVAWVGGGPDAGVTRIIRINASGVAPGWPDSGMALDAPLEVVEIRQLALDDAGGAVVLLQKFTKLSDRLVVHRVSATAGTPAGWPQGGAQLSTDYSLLIDGARLGEMRNGHMPVVWEESVTPMVVGETRSRFAIVGPTGVTTVGGRTHTLVCSAQGSQGEFAISRIDDNQTAVVWLEAAGPFQTNVRVSALTDDLTVDTDALLSASADCVAAGTRFSWRGDRLAGRTIELQRIAPDGTRSSVGVFTLDARSISIDFLARASAFRDGPLCLELAEVGVPVEGTRLCASCGGVAGRAPWQVASYRDDDSWRIAFRASTEIALDVQVQDIAGRRVGATNGLLAEGEVLTLSSESLRLPVGWYRVRARGGGHVTETSLVVIR